MVEWVDLLLPLNQLARIALLSREEAGQCLQRALVKGDIKTRALLLGGDDTARARFSLNPVGEISYIPSDFWKVIDVDWSMEGSEENPYSFVIEGDSDQRFSAYNVEALRVEALAYLHAFNEINGAENVSGTLAATEAPDVAEFALNVQNRHKGGRPVVHDWAGLAGHMTFYLVEQDPRERLLLSKEAFKYFEQLGKHPDQREIERFVYVLWKQYEPLRNKS
jgi:hypothetical protein